MSELKSESKHMHWSEWLAQRVISEKKEPYVISGGMTTSGPSHLGTLCEFLFPSVIRDAIRKHGKDCKYYFVADILDAFDSVPLAMEKYHSVLEPHLGKPLCVVPDPTGQSKSFGDHYLDEARSLMTKFNVHPQIIRINEYYESGKFDDWAKFYLENEAQTRSIVEETSGKAEKKDWSPIQPICQQCGKIATTRVTSHTIDAYAYSCDRDVKYTKGCGYVGQNKISDHKYKLVWRLHWPAWKQIFGTSIEGAGIDHHTKGGSEDTCCHITKDLMKKEYHIPYRYGFILFQGKKYSKSKGIGMGVSDMVKLLPIEVIKYMLVRPDLEENIDIDPNSENLLKTIEDFEASAKLDPSKLDSMNRSDQKKAIAFGISADNKTAWKVGFLDFLLYYQLYRNWDEVAKYTGDPQGAAYLRPYVEEWIARDFQPEDYKFKYAPNPSEMVKKFVSTLNSSMDGLAIHNAVYDFAKANGIEGRAMFIDIYRSLIAKDKGPRAGKLIAALGVDRLKKDLGI
ncbi:lysine--tRNA ligase [Candidatus Micrarchaeota archaeon]|nr:lysine--tRNA ligase [Candidatus Micrarchaeota archaeon]